MLLKAWIRPVPFRIFQIYRAFKTSTAFKTSDVIRLLDSHVYINDSFHLWQYPIEDTINLPNSEIISGLEFRDFELPLFVVKLGKMWANDEQMIARFLPLNKNNIRFKI